MSDFRHCEVERSLEHQVSVLRLEVRQLTQRVRDVQGEYQVHQIKLEAENAELRAEIARLTKTDISKEPCSP